MRKVVFLDRDGVINKEINYLHKIEDFEFTPFCVEALHMFKAKGFELAIVTNQAGIAKGYYSIKDYHELTRYYVDILKHQGIEFLSIQYCPHHPEGVVKPYSVKCECRKPKPGMITNIQKKYDVDLSQSVIIGDKKSDLKAGEVAGIEKRFLVETGHLLSEDDYRSYTVFQNMMDIANIV